MAKKRRIKGASAAGSLPTGAVLVGKLVAALGLPANGAGEKLRGNTAHRFFSGVRVEDEKVVEIFAAIGDVLVELGYAPTAGWRPIRGLAPARRAGLVLHHMSAKWDETLAELRSGILRDVDLSIVALAAARLAVVDIALRAAAWLALAGIELAETSTPPAVPRVAAILSDLITRTKLPRDEIATGCRVARTTVDDWAHGTRIVDDNLSNLVLLAADAPEADDILARTRRELALAAALTQLRAHLGQLGGEVDELWHGAVRLAGRFSRYMGRSRLIGEERFEPPSDVLAFGVSCDRAQYVLANALKHEDRPEWRAVLEVGPAWTEFLVHAARIGRSNGSVVKAGLSQEVERFASLALLARPRHTSTPVPAGWTRVCLVGDDATKASNRLVQARNALDRGDAGEAVGHARRAVELTPLAWLAHFRLGVALAAATHIDEAIVECAIAAELASTAADIERAKVEIGVVLTNAGRDEEARVQLEQLHDAASEASIHLLYNLGVVRMRCGRFADALDSFSKVIARDEHHPLALDHGAHCAFAVGNRRLGIDYAKRANLVGRHESYNAWTAGLYDRGG